MFHLPPAQDSLVTDSSSGCLKSRGDLCAVLDCPPQSRSGISSCTLPLPEMIPPNEPGALSACPDPAIEGRGKASPSHLSAHPGTLPLKCHMKSASTEAQGRGGSVGTAVGTKQPETSSPLLPWSRRGTVRCGRTRGCPLLGGGTKLGLLASPKEGLMSAEPGGGLAEGLWGLLGAGLAR